VNHWLLLLAAAVAGDAGGEVFVMETQGHTRFAYLPASVAVRASADGEVRSAMVVTHNPDRGTPRPDDQIGARGTMEFICTRHAYREVTMLSIRRSGEEIVVVPANPARPFAETRPESLERKLADAICQAPR
jgi:hypothetical protein